MFNDSRLDSIRKRRVNLVRNMCIKVNAGDEVYYLNEKAYCSTDDGFIDLKLITEKIYESSNLLGLRAIEVDLEDAQLHIQREIEEIRRRLRDESQTTKTT